MRTALDSSVVLDVLTNGPWAEASQQSIQEAMAAGSLVVGECVLAEIAPAFEAGEFEAFLADWGIQFIATGQTAAMHAGAMYRTYLSRKGTAKRVLPDFLIGAHALHHADRLLARDRGYYRDYFFELALLEPSRGH